MAYIKIAHEISMQRKGKKIKRIHRKLPILKTFAFFYLYITSDTHKYDGISKQA